MSLNIMYDRSAVHQGLHPRCPDHAAHRTGPGGSGHLSFPAQPLCNHYPQPCITHVLVGTFSVMYLAGYNLDNLSLMALTLCVGFVVDDAIVMLENIVRHMEHGESPRDAAFNGSKEISFTIISMTLSLVAVFIPVLFMGGIIGRLLNEFAVTIVVAVFISGFVSLSLTPMLCSIMLRPAGSEQHGKVYQVSERFFSGMLGVYEKSLQWVLHHRRSTLMVSMLFFLQGSSTSMPSCPRGSCRAEIQARSPDQQRQPRAHRSRP